MLVFISYDRSYLPWADNNWSYDILKSEQWAYKSRSLFTTYSTHKKYSSALIFAIFASLGS